MSSLPKPGQTSAADSLVSFVREHARLTVLTGAGCSTESGIPEYRDDDGNWVNTDATDPQRYAEYAQTWIEAGAAIVGGCCGTTPAHVRALAGLRLEA